MNAEQTTTTMKATVKFSLLGKQVYRVLELTGTIDDINNQLAELSGKEIDPGWDTMSCSLAPMS